MDIRDLRYFTAAAELGQLRRAAERVGRSQPALTKCIHRLEAELGAPLFERKGHRIRLTAVGEALLVRARSISISMDAAVREVADIAAGSAGHVRLGAGSTTAECFLPGLFHIMLRQFPKVTFDVVIGLGDHLRQLLRDRELDLIVGPLLEGDGVEFVTLPAAADELVVAAAAMHRLAGKRIRIKDLLGERWLLPAPSLASTRWLNQAFETRHLPRPQVQIQTSTVVLLRRVVSQTSLLTFISRRDLAGAGTSPVLSEIRAPELALRRELGILHLRECYLPPAAHRLIELTRTHAKAMLEIGDAAPARPRRMARPLGDYQK